MTREEFARLTKRPFNDKEYKIIEYVYTYYPSITNIMGKQQIADLYTIGGMALIHDMYHRAQEVEALDTEIRKTRAKLQQLEENMQVLRTGGQCDETN